MRPLVLRNKVMSVFFLIAFVVVAGMISMGCSSGGSNAVAPPAQKVRLSGTIGTGYTPTASAAPKTFFARLFSYFEKNAYAVPVFPDVNKIIALPTVNGDLTGYSVVNSVSTAVNTADGTFSLSLDKSNDWVILLLNTNATSTAQFVGSVALKADASNSLLNLPVSTAAASSIDLGTIDNAGNDTGLTTNPTNTADFSLTAAQLLTLAQTDEAYRNAKNLVVNYNNGVWYTLRPDFFWDGDYTTLAVAASDPLAYAYGHYNFQLDSNSTQFTMASTIGNLCSATTGTPVLELFPPSGTEAVSSSPTVTYGDMTPITNDHAICTTITGGFIEASELQSGGDFFASNQWGNISYGFGGFIGGTIPAGYWRYYINHVLTGEFDVAAVAPLATNGALKGFSPSIKVNIDGNNKITSVDITWYVVSDDGLSKTPVAPADLHLLKHLIGTGDVFFDNSSGPRRYESVHFDPSTQTSITPAWTWYYNDASAGNANELAQSIGIFFNSAGVGYYVQFFK